MTLQTIRSRGAAAVRALLAPSGGAPPGDLPRTGAPRAVLLGAVSAVLLAAPRPAAAQTPAVATPAVQTSPARAPRALSLDDAVRLAERQSEAVRIAEAGALRARGQFLQARSQILPQLNATGAYQKQLQNQFQALQRSVPAAAPDPARPVTLCTPELPAGATAAERTAALAQARTCPASDGGLGAAFRAFASPNNIILGLSGSQVLFAGGRVSAGLQAATAARRAADIAIGAARAQVTLDVAQAYYDAALSDRLVAIAESSLVQTERAFRQTAVARQVGNVSEFDLLRARVARDNQRPVLIQSRATRDVAYTRLRQLLDLPLDEPLALSTALPMPPGSDPVPVRRTAGTLADATAAPRTQVPGARRGTPSGPPLDGAPLDGGPLARTVADPIYTTVDVDVAEVLAEDATVLAAVDSAVTAADTAARGRAPARQAVENVTAQRNLLRAARAQRLPGVQLSTNYQRFAYPAGDGISLPTALNQFFPNWTVTLGVSVPILTGGRIRGDELIAEANLREAQQTSRQVEELAALDARLAVSQLAQAEAAWRASAGTAGEAERAYTIAEVRFREGIATQVDLADTRLLLQQAQANAATAARDREVARLRLQLLRDLPLGQGTTGGQQQNGAGARPGGGFAPSGGGAAPQQPRGGQQQPGQQGPGGFQQASTGGVP